MSVYSTITLVSVSGFCEKSRKLRDFYGAYLIMVYLREKLIESVKSLGYQVILPALLGANQIIPNGILIEGQPSEDQIKDILLYHWQGILKDSRQWIETQVPETKNNPDTYYHWGRDWKLWGNHAWEIFIGKGETISQAMQDLQCRQLSQNWVGINWIGESSTMLNIEALPESSILIFSLAIRHNLKRKKQELFKNQTHLEMYFGGLESIGFGHCNVILKGV